MQKGGSDLERKYIRAVTPKENYILQLEFVTGSVLQLDLSKRLSGIRLRPPRDPDVWRSAVTNGIYVRWGDTELSYDELLSMASEEPPF